jgi:UDP-N-acetylmuramate--alanine ligase
MRRDIDLIHFISIGDIDMSGNARMLRDIGYQVQGSNIAKNANVRRLRELGIHIEIGQRAENVETAQVVVVSSAVNPDNPEVVAARERFLPVVRRAEMLGELMRLKWSIAVGGTHGKTTTTSMVASLLDGGGFDPTVINGGIINAYGTNARLGAGDWMVVEADESDGTFVKLPATIAVVTNIDPEHLDFYGSVERLHQAFESFVENIPFYGFAVVCIDHPAVQALIGRIVDRRMITYGFSPQADVRARDIRQSPDGAVFSVEIAGRFEDKVRRIEDLRLPMLGEHNVLNALAAIAVASEMGMSDAQLRDALSGFTGVKRRFTRTGEVAGVTIVDDYGHHPVEIAAVLAAAVVVAGLYRKDRLGEATGVALLCVLVPLDFWLAGRTVNPVVDESFYTRPPPIQEPLAMDEIQRTYRYRATPYEEHLGTFYSFPELSVEAAKWLWQQTMQPASGVLWDVRAHDATDAIHLRPILATDSLLRRGPEQRRRRLLRLGSVKYVYQPVASADLPRSEVIRLQELPGFVYRLEETLPRAYLAHGERARSRDEAIDSILEPSAPYRRRVMISEEDGGPVASGRFSGELAVPGEEPENGGGQRPGPPPGEAARENRPADAGRGSESRAVGTGSADPQSRIDPRGDLPDPGSAKIVEDRGERIRLRVDPDTASYLVLTDTWYPGWRARVDGEDRPVVRANHFFKAVRVRPGGESVEFRYRS